MGENDICLHNFSNVEKKNMDYRQMKAKVKN